MTTKRMNVKRERGRFELTLMLFVLTSILVLFIHSPDYLVTSAMQLGILFLAFCMEYGTLKHYGPDNNNRPKGAILSSFVMFIIIIPASILAKIVEYLHGTSLDLFNPDFWTAMWTFSISWFTGRALARFLYIRRRINTSNKM